MPKQIQVDNQIIEFPDDMPDNEIEAVIKKEFYSQPQPQPQQPIKPAQPFGMGAELVKKASEYIPQQGRVGAFLNTATNLVGMPRVKALTASLSAKALGGDESIGAFYDEALGNELNKLKQARREYPVQSFASQLATDISGGGAILKGLGLAGTTVKQALAGGAVIGGLSAGGETEADLASSQGLADIGAKAWAILLYYTNINKIEDIQKLPLDWFQNVRQSYKTNKIIPRKREIVFQDETFRDQKKKI